MNKQAANRLRFNEEPPSQGSSCQGGAGPEGLRGYPAAAVRGRLWICASHLAPLPGELSAQLTERLPQICIEKPKPQIQFAVWKGRNGLRGKEAPRTAGTRSVEAGSDAPPAALSFPSCRKRWGRKGALGYGLVHTASEFRRVPMFRASFHTIVTLRASYYALPDT